MRTPMLQTERMVLRPLFMTDAENIFNRWTSNERVTKYVRWSTHTELGQKDFVAWHAIENHASGAVMKKCGFVFLYDTIDLQIARKS